MSLSLRLFTCCRSRTGRPASDRSYKPEGLIGFQRGRRAHKGVAAVLLVNDRDVRIVTQDGELIRELTIDPTRLYQGQGT